MKKSFHFAAVAAAWFGAASFANAESSNNSTPAPAAAPAPAAHGAPAGRAAFAGHATPAAGHVGRGAGLHAGGMVGRPAAIGPARFAHRGGPSVGDRTFAPRTNFRSVGAQGKHRLPANVTRDNRRAPFVVDRDAHRGWDRHRDHIRGHRRYHWSGSSWVIYGLGSYPYGYPYGYAGGAYYAVPPAEYIEETPIEAQVQRRLADAGYYHGEIDGLVGPGTRRAIANFQRDHGLAVNGRISRPLLDALDVG